MTSRQKYLAILSAIVPAGPISVSLLLGSTTPSTADTLPMATKPPIDPARVSERLAAIRDAVSTIARTRAADAKTAGRLAWGNWGWGWGAPWSNWPNWNNWNNWRNWGNWWNNWGGWHRHHGDDED